MRSPEERPEAGLKLQGRVFGESQMGLEALHWAEGTIREAAGLGAEARRGRGWGCGLAAQGVGAQGMGSRGGW